MAEVCPEIGDADSAMSTGAVIFNRGLQDITFENLELSFAKVSEPELAALCAERIERETTPGNNLRFYRKNPSSQSGYNRCRALRVHFERTLATSLLPSWSRGPEVLALRSENQTPLANPSLISPCHGHRTAIPEPCY